MSLRRAAPLLCGVAACAGAVYVALHDPSVGANRYPACVFHSSTGLWCPGCGLTRGFHQLFNGNLAGAIGHNVFVPIAFVAAVLGWWSWVRRAYDRAPLQLPPRAKRFVAIALPAALAVYAVARNIPHEPFTALAP